MPWTWGAIGITWNDAELPGGLESWYDLLDPKFKGKIGIVNDPAGLHTLGSHILGYDPAEVTHDQLPEVVDLVEPVRRSGKECRAGVRRDDDPDGGRPGVACYQGWAYQNYLQRKPA